MKSLRVALVLLILWESGVRVLQLPEFLLPAPSRVVWRLFIEIAQPYMLDHIRVTLFVSIHGLLQGAFIGVGFGWIFFHVPALKANFAWILTSSQAIPVIALAPLLLIWLPDTYWARVWVATIITFFPVYSATYTALTRIPVELREVAAIFGASRGQTVLLLEGVQAAPVVLSGMRTSMALATTGAVVGEFLGGRDGLGALINIARGLFDTTLVFVSIILLIVITLFFRFFLDFCIHFLTRHADGSDNSPTTVA